jgi:hypothetical protein
MNWFKHILSRPWLTMVSKHLHTIMGKPYFKVIVFQTGKVGTVAIDAHYNIHFIYALDAVYAQAGSDYYDPSLEDQGKVAIYLYDTTGNIAENYMPPEQLIVDEDDIAADVPVMGFRGGEEVRTVVDLAEHPNSPAASRTSPLDVKMG